MNLANGLADVRGISILTLQRGSTQLCAAAWCALLIAVAPAQAEETVCAKVKIEIKQELTLERQAFDAEMKINNTTDRA
ncbi:hypothetical protein [Deefgea sp. CFH1-16]|uniref:hypothetical protein n=1 Tax=Deefgea sp. CFH1-16 TaxID=2675457 RepID=UPI0015F6EED3|nr:hypothetical protein [Deefgea sp. CFH1-16]MBM5575369.1 hypothetical protein [Deefgea sp. CFH1-16]